MQGQQSDSSRRAFLATISSGVAVALAGCSSSGASSNDSGGETPTEETTEATTEATTETTTEPTTETATDAPGEDDVDREIEIVSESFKFTPGSDEPIRVEKGETIKLTATAEDDGLGTGHGLGIPQLGINLAPLLPDNPKSAVFTADTTGEFKMICTIQCSQPGAGVGHGDMTGLLVVEE